jgi:hypothetical protein
MIPFKIVVTADDFAYLFDCSYETAKWHLCKIRKKLGKPPRGKVFASEVAEYSGCPENEVLKALNRELW